MPSRERWPLEGRGRRAVIFERRSELSSEGTRERAADRGARQAGLRRCASNEEERDEWFETACATACIGCLERFHCSRVCPAGLPQQAATLHHAARPPRQAEPSP